MNTPDGPSCASCASSEARCAWLSGCCIGCTHLFGEYDAPGCTICAAPIAQTGGRRPARCSDCQREYGASGAVPLFSCGTPAAYRRHLRHGEKACSACLEAEARQGIDAMTRRNAS